MDTTAVVILNWNGLSFLKKFLGRITECSTGPGTAIYVADNGSDDGSVSWIAENHKDVRLIRFDHNHGFAGGYNLALEQVDAEFYVLLNSDIEVTEGWLEPLTGFLKANPEAAACQPKILSYSNKDHFEYAGAAGGFIDKYGYPFCRGRIFDSIEKDNGQYNDQVRIFWATGACMAVRAGAWKKCGGFDASFFAHMEEIDLCWRFYRAGYTISYVPGSVVYHVGGGALPYNSPFKTFLNFRNSLFLLYRNLDDSSLHRILFIRKLLDGLAAIMFLLKGQGKSAVSVFKAHMAYYRKINELKVGRTAVRNLGPDNFSAPVLNKSIVFQFYAKGRKTYSALKRSI